MHQKAVSYPDTAELFGLKATLSLDTWDAEMNNRSCPKFTLTVSTLDGELSEEFDFYGSAMEADERTGRTTVEQAVEMVAQDALMWYRAGGGIPTDTEITVESLQNEHKEMIEYVAEEWGIKSPGEAVDAFASVLETAQKFHRVKCNEEGLDTVIDYVQD